ncbi:MAG: hypothetical protein HQK56_15385 [Deltaproteobacteria bacterium]|nr:hypothetical protein [Deltaproteobacteria bacterium]
MALVTNKPQDVNLLSEEQLEEKRKHHLQEEYDSFERCDTDGFLSQWAHGISASEARLALQIKKDGGTAEFCALFDLEGNRVKAKLAYLDSKFTPWQKTPTWLILDENDRIIRYVKAFPMRKSTMEKKGFVEGMEQAPAKAIIHGSGKGLSGAATCRAIAIRTDKGYPSNAKVHKG